MNNYSNANEDFHNIATCDFTKHWSLSLFFRNLAILEQVNKLPHNSCVVEVGSANSHLREYAIANFGRKDIRWIEMDANPDYAYRATIHDVTKPFPFGNIDMIIAAEVIEHMSSKFDCPSVIDNFYNALVPNGILVLTTPTPIPWQEKLVWPDSHEYEFNFGEIYDLVNKWFEINKAIPWSIKEREYNSLLEIDPLFQKVYGKLREAYPESLIRAFLSLLCENQTARQTMLIAKKRRAKDA